MTQTLLIRAATAQDEAGWRKLWQGFLDYYQVVLPDDVTSFTWHRLMDPASPLAARLPADPTRVERLAYGPGPGGVAVNGLLIHGGGHTWPGGTTPGLLKLLGVGRTSGQLDASRAIWGFFQQHRRVR